MIEYIHGNVVSLTPTAVVIETSGGVAYLLNISVNTFGKLQGATTCRVFVSEVIREDAYTLYGFADEREREAFEQLVSVSGVGAGTARIILSGLTVDELQEAILSENVAVFKNIKGIGAKTAQRLIVDLKDKMAKSALGGETPSLPIGARHEVRSEALAALQMLGYVPAQAGKVVDRILKDRPQLTVEQVIKAALQQL